MAAASARYKVVILLLLLHDLLYLYTIAIILIAE